MMTKNHILSFLFIVILLVGCGQTSNTPFEMEMSIEIIRSPEEKVDIDSVFESAQRIIKEKLPKAEYAGTFYKQSCENQGQQNGKITFLFKEIRQEWFGFKEQILFAWFVVNLDNGKVNLSITNESDNDPSVDKYKKISNDDFQKMMAPVDNYLTEHNIENCSLAITEMKDYWHVLIWSPDRSMYLAEFGIDDEYNIVKVSDPITK